MELINIFNVVQYKYPGFTFQPCKGLWEAQKIADDMYRTSGFKESAVVEYDGDIIYRAQRRPHFSI